MFSPARVFDAADAGDLGSRAIAWWGVPCHDTFKNQVRVDGGRTDVRGVALSLGSASMLGFPAGDSSVDVCIDVVLLTIDFELSGSPRHEFLNVNSNSLREGSSARVGGRSEA